MSVYLRINNEKRHLWVVHETKDTIQKILFMRVLPYICRPVIGREKPQPQAQRCADPVMRSLERLANTVQKAVAREDPAVQARESAQRALAREDHVARSLEQSANTAQQAVARENLAVQRHESAQQAVATEDPEVRAHEPAQQAVAREDPAAQDADLVVDVTPTNRKQHNQIINLKDVVVGEVPLSEKVQCLSMNYMGNNIVVCDGSDTSISSVRNICPRT